jgi:hypothetical protein
MGARPDGAARARARSGPVEPDALSPEIRDLLARLRGRTELVAHVVRERPDEWYTRVAPGCYAVCAFEDVNRDSRYEDEPALRAADPARIVSLAPGERREVTDLVIPPDGRLLIDAADPTAEQLRGLAARSATPRSSSCS